MSGWRKELNKRNLGAVWNSTGVLWGYRDFSWVSYDWHDCFGSYIVCPSSLLLLSSSLSSLTEWALWLIYFSLPDLLQSQCLYHFLCSTGRSRWHCSQEICCCPCLCSGSKQAGMMTSLLHLGSQEDANTMSLRYQRCQVMPVETVS